VGLPSLIVLTDGSGTGGRPLVPVVAAAVEGGARAVLLREKHCPRAERLRLAAQITALLGPVGGTLLVASDPSIPAAGVHLAATDPFPALAPAAPSGASQDAGRAPRLVGRSCHSPTEVARAAAEGCAYATLSPVYLTASKPGYGPALGIGALRGLGLPTWALGGVDASNARACLEAGASGVAVMGAIMRADDPAATVAAILASLAQAAGRNRADR
jgi:thiamine-phosphate pyrophosphorylase